MIAQYGLNRTGFGVSMRTFFPGLGRPISCFLITLLVFPSSRAATPSLSQGAGLVLPDGDQSRSDGQDTRKIPTTAAQPEPVRQQTDPKPAEGAEQKPQTSVPADTKQQNSVPPPVGTAAAPSIRREGVPGSRPAGAAIAPGKQRRTRSFAIRVGLLVGAGIAIGTVVAASLGSPSRPQ